MISRKKIFEFTGNSTYSPPKFVFTSSNTILVSLTPDRITRVWNLQNHEENFILDILQGKIITISVTSTGHNIVLTSDNELCIWETSSRTIVGRRTCNFIEITCSAITNDSQLLVIGTMNGIIRILNLANLDEKDTLWGHKLQVYLVAISRSDAFIISASADKTIRLWSIQNRQQEIVLEGLNRIFKKIIMTDDEKYAICQLICPYALYIFDLGESQNKIEVNQQNNNHWNSRYKEVRRFMNN